MSSKKEKFLDSAQKFLAKGQLDRALREYEQAVALDPKDVRVRQRYAELLVRAGRKDDAVREFEAIGKYYADNGFYLKAIAVYKQIQKITPSNLDISLVLASLNEKQGLIGNALAEYKFVFDRYEQSNRLVDAVSVLERMLSADRENLNIRLKLAETRYRAGMLDDSYRDFTELAHELKARGNDNAYLRVCEQIGTLFPERREFLLTVAENHLKDGKPAEAISILRGLVSDERLNPRALYLLADAARMAGEPAMVKGAYGRIVKNYPGEIAAIKGFLFCLKSEGNVEDGIRFLRQVESELLATEPETLEQFYLRFRELDPDHPGIAEGLQRVRDAVAPEVESPATGQEPSDQTPSLEEESESSPINLSQQPTSDVCPPDESPWEEEIEISIEEMDGAVEVVSPLSGEDYGEPFLSGADGHVGIAEEEESSVRFDDGEVDEAEVEVELPDFSAFPSLSDEWPAGAGHDGIGEAEGSPREEDISFDFDDEDLENLILPQTTVSRGAKGDKYGLDGLFSAFKKQVDEQLSRDDTESHYSLGIAYMEMGLYDDAIAEFEAAGQDPRRSADSITLQGICCREKGDMTRAEEYFRSGLELHGLKPEERVCLIYELALLYETMGEIDRALGEYRKVMALDPDFRDTVQKVGRLQGEVQDQADMELVELDEIEEGAG